MNPEKKFRAGAISATVWKNEAKDGMKPYRTVSLERNYKDKQSKWQTTNSFRLNDLARVELVVRQAFEFAVQSSSQEEIVL